MAALRQLDASPRVVRFGGGGEPLAPTAAANLFASASVVVGVHGAGLANAIMCRRRAALIELSFDADADGAAGPPPAAGGCPTSYPRKTNITQQEGQAEHEEQ